jgi:hypothetical protein
MKAPKPPIPQGDSPGMSGPIEWSHITFRILGDELDPDEITRLLRCEPHLSERKGVPTLRPHGTVAPKAKTGQWRLALNREETDEWDCAQAIMELMSNLPKQIELLRDLTGRYEVHLFVVLSLLSRHKGFSLPPEVMMYLGERGIKADFDVCYEKNSAVPKARWNGE